MTPPADRKGLLKVMAKAAYNCTCDECTWRASDILTALESAGVRLVPAEVTEVQIGAAYSREIKDDERAYVSIYRAMRDASPYAEKKA